MEYQLNNLFYLSNEEIQSATQKEYRQYFCGNLKRPQLLNFIRTENLEIGISNYMFFQADEPHLHTRTADMVYILQGEYHIWLLKENQKFVLKEGDFFSVPPQSPYASKAKAKTKVLFIKQLKDSDKESVPITIEIEEWLKLKI